MFKNKMWGLWVSFAAALSVLLSAATVYADTAVTTLGVRFSDNYDSEGKEILAPSVSYEGSGFTERDVSWSKDVDKWKPGSKVTVTITLVADEGKRFESSYNSSQIAVSGADFISAKDDGEGGLIIKAGYYPVVQLGNTESAGWSDAAKTKAVWKKVPFATSYQLRLYSGEGTYEVTLTLEGTSLDLSEHLTKQANYYYEVRATSKDRTDAKFMKSGDYVLAADNLIEDVGETGGHWQQAKEGCRYTDEQGISAVNGWRYILGSWYYFDENGYAVTGWKEVDGKWYYMNSDFKMMTGWLNLGDKWYYTSITGAMVTGWYQTAPDEFYYFNGDGSMAVSTVVDGYTISDTGKIQQTGIQ